MSARQSTASNRPKKHRDKDASAYAAATKNSHIVNTRLRAELRQLKISEIRAETERIHSVLAGTAAEKESRIQAIVADTNESVDGMLKFLDDTAAEYDAMLQRYSPPKEKSIDDIVRDMEQDFERIFDVYKAEMEFTIGDRHGSAIEQDISEEASSARSIGSSSIATALTGEGSRRPLSPKLSWRMMEKDAQRIRARCAENIQREAELRDEIAKENELIEKEKIGCAGIRHEQMEEEHYNERRIEQLMDAIREAESAPPEQARIDELEDQIKELKEERQRVGKRIEEVDERTRVARTRSTYHS